MDFFAGQDRARGRTKLLVGLYALAVVCICVAVSLVVVVVLGFSGGGGDLPGAEQAVLIIAIACVATLTVIGLGTGYKLAQLRGGGRVIASRLGGRLLVRGQTSGADRVLENVVDEMAIASGVPSPPIYVMENESSINAFAAGYSPEDAVVGVTRGTVDSLSRDELQGVIAHEFSHILNGDMRLNIRLIGVLHGITVIAYAGYFILRFGVGGSGGRRSGNRDGGGAAQVALIGVALLVIGGIGAVFGSVIKAAVSRQREYLADASAVQFTRNPEGIGGALKRIMAATGGGKRVAALSSSNAPEAEHMLFSEGVKRGLTSVMATHPPLGKRIRAIEPGWDGSLDGFDVPTRRERAAERARERRRAAAEVSDARQRALEVLTGAGLPGVLVGGAAAASSEGGGWHVRGRERGPRRLLGASGELSTRSVAAAAAALESVPESLRDAAADAFTARWVVVGLVFAHADAGGLDALKGALAEEPEGSRAVLERLGRESAEVEPWVRLPLVDVCLASLRAMCEAQVEAFSGLLDRAVRSDGRVDVLEWALVTHVRAVLTGEVDGGGGRTKYYGLGRLGRELSVVLSAVARAGHGDEAEARAAFEAGADGLKLAGVSFVGAKEADADGGGASDLGRALDELRLVSSALKRDVLEACARVLSHDDAVTVGEAELFRAVASAFGVPVPMVAADAVEGLELPGDAAVAEALDTDGVS